MVLASRGLRRSQDLTGTKNQDCTESFGGILVLGSWFQGGPRTSQFFFLSDYVLSIIHTNVELVCHIAKVICFHVEPAYQVEILDYVLSITYDNVELACHIEKIDYVLSVVYISLKQC